MYWIIFIVFALASYIISSSLERKFKKYSQVGIALTGKEVAEKMLRDHGITDVTVTCTRGHLTDHYNPTNKTVNLSESVYSSASVAAAAVAAHECGHAVQHATEYAPLSLRSALVPVVNFANTIMTWLMLAGLIFFAHGHGTILLVAIAAYAVTTLFSFITLPVEINASSRAIEWMSEAGITRGEETEMAKDALKSAAYTYVVAALASLATLVYYILVFMGSNRR